MFESVISAEWDRIASWHGLMACHPHSLELFIYFGLRTLITDWMVKKDAGFTKVCPDKSQLLERLADCNFCSTPQ
jgi:hypothetical protein